MYSNDKQSKASFDAAPPAKSVQINVTAVTIPRTALSRTEIRDREVHGQCFAPVKQPSISVDLFAYILKQDPDDVRHKVGIGQSFVYMSWSFAPGAAARFKTRLILTEEGGLFVMLPNGLEAETRLHQYLKSITNAQKHQPPTNTTGSCQPDDGSSRTECGSDQCEDGSDQDDVGISQIEGQDDLLDGGPSNDETIRLEEEPGPLDGEIADSDANKKLLDEVLYIERRDAEQRHPENVASCRLPQRSYTDESGDSGYCEVTGHRDRIWEDYGNRGRRRW